MNLILFSFTVEIPLPSVKQLWLHHCDWKENQPRCLLQMFIP